MKTMKTSNLVAIVRTSLAAVALMAAAFAANVSAAPAQLNGQVVLRPLTPQDLKDYGLTNNVQLSGGMSAVGVGQPVYLEALVNSAVLPAHITNVTFTLTSRPLGSVAELQPSPLGANVPPFNMRDRLDRQVAGRSFLRPDVAGQYAVAVQIQAGGSSVTNGTTNITVNITAGTYVGAGICALCHSGGVVAENTYTPWTGTLHSHAFKDGINGVSSDHFASRCTSCHVVGYDTHTNAVNGGFDDIAKQYNWQFPTTMSPTNWDAMPAALRNVANVQCESCHGPGSEHAAALGNTNAVNWPRLGTTLAAGSCAQCHDSLSHHYKTAEWKNSRHAAATRTPSGPTRTACVRCHTAPGFEQFISNAGNTNGYVTNTTYEAITCAACHDPHDASKPHQLRAANIYTLPEGTTVTNVGLGALCMTCHHSRNGSASNNIANYKAGLATWAGGSNFGVHDSTAGDMVEGVNGITYGRFIPSGSHSATISNTCVGCHMQEVAATDPGFTKVGGHTFAMSYTVVTNGVTNTIPKVEICVKCHGEIEDFNMVRKDYDGDGKIEGIQTEVQNLLNKLSTLLPNSTYRADGNYVADGLVKTSISVKTNWPTKFLNAAWNWQFVNVEGSRGIHNAPYAVGLLKASIADLTDDWNNDGLPDTWQIANFGSLTNKDAAPTATPAGDDVPNFLKYSLGINPKVAGIAVPDGVIWAGADGTTLVNPPGTNTVIKVYTAAEIAFDTVVGKTYQIQAISSLGGTWQNVGTPIAGTGAPVRYVASLRTNVRQFYRVVITP